MTLDRKPKRKILPPNRALLAEKDGRKFALTWCLDKDEWRCWYRAKLHWLKSLSPTAAKQELERRGFTFHWIVPDIGAPIAPPFS